MEYAREVFFADLDAGFDVLHVDATEDPTVDGPLPIDEVADRTVRLIDDIETRRRAAGHDPVHYEVGTEEIAGGLTDADSFERYIDLLHDRLADAGRAGVSERVVFVVGQVGTTMRIDRHNEFDPERAARLVDIANDHDMHIKVHYTDWLDDDALARFPSVGVGAANVGPEFAAEHVAALADLEARADTLAADRPDVTAPEVLATLEAAAVDYGGWPRLAPADVDLDDDAQRAAFLDRHRREIAHLHGRYVLDDDEVTRQRRELKRVVRTHGDVDPGTYVVDAIQTAIHRYVEAFNLRGSAGRLGGG
jgi:tagatose-1,6-bisphosphate aldolase non-catalytic subunit AgaZ/GatZ